MSASSNALSRVAPATCLLIVLLAALPSLGADGQPATARPAAALNGTGGLVLDSIATGFDTVVDISQAGDDRLFFSLQDGEILIYDGDPPPLATFLDLSGIVGGGFEGGIKSVAFHPDYVTNGFFFVHYSDVLGDSVVARYEVSSDPDVADPSSGVILVTVDQTTDLHRGGQIAFGPDGYLYIGFGDGGPQTDTECHAQSPDTFQGKLLRIDVDQNVDTPPFYGIPGDNPFGGAGEPAAEVWALGLRQPWRFSFDRSSGDLYIADVGQVSREEVDFQPAGSPGGQNYGWRIMEGTDCHDPDPIDPDCPPSTPSCDDPGFTDPIFDYGRENGECSITGGHVYRGHQLGSLFGRYLYGDWCTGRVWAADDSSGPWASEELPISVPGITTFGEDPSGNLYVSDGSSVFRIDDPAAIFFDGFESGDTLAW